jgi:hypothetical protein
MEVIPDTLMTLLRLVAAGPFPLTFAAEPTIRQLERLAEMGVLDLAVTPVEGPPKSVGRRAVVLGVLPEGKHHLLGT